MSTEERNETVEPTRSPTPFRLWSSVLPKAIGPGVVAALLVGLGGISAVAIHVLNRQGDAYREREGAALAQLFAVALGSVDDQDEQGVGDLLQQLGRTERVRRARWVARDGTVRYRWPANNDLADRASTTYGGSGSEFLAAAPIRSAGGEPRGTVELSITPALLPTPWARLGIGIGLSAGAALLGMVILYVGLRRHLKPAAAIQRNLQSYADGIETQLLALTLSDSLGHVAQAWNALVRELAGLQGRRGASAEDGAVDDVLQRFETRRLREILDRLPLGVMQIGQDNHVRYANGSARALLGHTADDLVGVSLADAVEEEAVAQALASARSRSAAGVTIDRARGEGEQERTLRFCVPPMRPDEDETLVTIQDVSTLKEAQRAQNTFLHHVAHELRAPLTNIRAYAETLGEEMFDNEQTRKECYNTINSETQRLSRLVEDILSIAQLESGTARLAMGDVDLARMVRQMVQDNQGVADEKKIDLTLKLAPKVPTIRGDKQRLSVLVNNLISNAIKYTPKQGRVDISLEITERGLLLSVADTGIGIDPADQPHVFDKFFRASHPEVQKEAGTGLGLAMAREVAQSHGGHIHLQSEPGQGTTFTLELPRPAGDA